jgi:hypothetical protein
MTPGWQDLVVAALTLFALGWLVWRRVRARRRGATQCENCPSASPSRVARPLPRIQVLYPIERREPPQRGR